MGVSEARPARKRRGWATGRMSAHTPGPTSTVREGHTSEVAAPGGTTVALMSRRTVPRGSERFEVSSGTATLRWDGTRATLLLDDVESSNVDVADPTHLEFEYMQHMDAALDTLMPSPTPVRALHLGAAACALPWAWARSRPGSRQVAVEIDQLLAEHVREWFDLPRSPELRIRVGDGRDVLSRARPGALDVVVRDAFDHGAVPSSLGTVEAAREAARALRPGGLYLLNAAHGGPADARPDVSALLEVFPLVCAVTDPKVGRSQRRGNVVLVAQTSSHEDDRLDLDELDRHLRRLPLPARVLRGRALERWTAGAPAPRDPSAVQALRAPEPSARS